MYLPSELSDDWQLQFDLPQQDGDAKQECNPNQPFPPHIASTIKRPDEMLWADMLKMVKWIELTSPWEDNLKKWHFQKHENYSKLAVRVRNHWWTLHTLCFEVDARGKTNDTWLQLAKAFSMKGSESKKLRLRVA
mgnify:CR=1 FL=1